MNFQTFNNVSIKYLEFTVKRLNSYNFFFKSHMPKKFYHLSLNSIIGQTIYYLATKHKFPIY